MVGACPEPCDQVRVGVTLDLGHKSVVAVDTVRPQALLVDGHRPFEGERMNLQVIDDGLPVFRPAWRGEVKRDDIAQVGVAPAVIVVLRM